MDRAIVIKQARDRLGLSQRGLAKMLGVSAGMIGQLESDPSKGIGLANAVSLARILQIPIGTIVGGDLPDEAVGMNLTDSDEIALVSCLLPYFAAIPCLSTDPAPDRRSKPSTIG